MQFAERSLPKRSLGQRLVAAMPILIGVCLLWSAMAKTVDLAPTIALLTSRGFQFQIASMFAWTLVFVEIFLGCWLLSGVRASLAGIAAGIFLVIGSASILYQLWTKSQLSCGCGLPTFGLSPESGQLLGLIRNAILIVMVVLGSIRARSRRLRVERLKGVRDEEFLASNRCDPFHDHGRRHRGRGCRCPSLAGG